MDQNTQDLLETVIFIKDNMATKDDLKDMAKELREEMGELEKKMEDEFATVRKEMKEGFAGNVSRMGAIDNRIDNEIFARKDFEHRVHSVLPTLPLVTERV